MSLKLFHTHSQEILLLIQVESAKTFERLHLQRLAGYFLSSVSFSQIAVCCFLSLSKSGHKRGTIREKSIIVKSLHNCKLSLGTIGCDLWPKLPCSFVIFFNFFFFITLKLFPLEISSLSLHKQNLSLRLRASVESFRGHWANGYAFTLQPLFSKANYATFLFSV